MTPRYLIAAVPLLLWTAPALAQQAPDYDCSYLAAVSFDADNNHITACAASQRTAQSLHVVNDAVAQALRRRFAPVSVSPAGLTVDAAEALDRLSPSAISIVPTADLAAAAPVAPRWNVWLDGRTSRIDGGAELSDLDGPLTNLVLGADYKISDAVILGMMALREVSHQESMGTRVETDGWGAGVYGAWSINQTWMLSANGAWYDFDNEGNGIFYDNSRVQTAAALNGNYYSGTWRFTPSLSVAWSREKQKETSGGWPDQTFYTGALSPSLQIGNTVALSDRVTVEPWAGAQLDWNFLDKTREEGLGTVRSDPDTDLRLQAGLNFSFTGRAQLALIGEMSGLIMDDSDAWMGGAQFAVQF